MSEPVSLSGVKAAVKQGGLAWAELTERAADIILFGSRALGLENPNSDWDLLCVGVGPTLSRGSLDLVWVSEQSVRSKSWLGSELASHVAAFGRPLVGSCAWIGDAHVAEHALLRKRRRIGGHMAAMARVWTMMRPSFHARQAVLLRREFQRAYLLAKHTAVPPGAVLDMEWYDNTATEERWYELTSWCSAEQVGWATTICCTELVESIQGA